MKTIQFDFSTITNYNDFYSILSLKIDLPEHFGKNLDALYDVITGDIELPLRFEFHRIDLSQLDAFDALIATLEEAAEEIDGFEFFYYMEQYEV